MPNMLTLSHSTYSDNTEFWLSFSSLQHFHRLTLSPSLSKLRHYLTLLLWGSNTLTLSLLQQCNSYTLILLLVTLPHSQTLSFSFNYIISISYCAKQTHSHSHYNILTFSHSFSYNTSMLPHYLSMTLYHSLHMPNMSTLSHSTYSDNTEFWHSFPSWLHFHTHTHSLSSLI